MSEVDFLPRFDAVSGTQVHEKNRGRVGGVSVVVLDDGGFPFAGSRGSPQVSYERGVADAEFRSFGGQHMRHTFAYSLESLRREFMFMTVGMHQE